MAAASSSDVPFDSPAPAAADDEEPCDGEGSDVDEWCFLDSDEETDGEFACSDTSEREKSTKAWLDHMLKLYLRSRISALDMCVMCYHALKGGMSPDLLKPFAKAPGASVGDYQRHLSCAVGLQESKKLVLTVRYSA